MRRTSILHAAAALVLASFVGISCAKEMTVPEDGTPVTVTGTIVGDASTKVSFEEGTSAIKSKWEVGDKIIGWDETGAKLELEIASSDRITAAGEAVFTLVSGSAALPTQDGKKIYMIYAPGKTRNDLTTSGLTYNLSTQTDKVPALMTATGTLAGGQIKLDFGGELALVAVKNPKLPVSTATTVTNLKLSGNNVKSSVTIGKNLTVSATGGTAITRNCSFNTLANGTTSGVMVYFAVPPTSTTADVTVSTVTPSGFLIVKTGASFAAGKCHLLNGKTIDKQKFAITCASVSNGTFTTSPSGSAEWDATVTVTPNPAQYYELVPNSINVTKAGGGTVDLSTQTTFTMPKDNVTVSGAFQKVKYKLTSSVNDVTMGSVLLSYTTGGSTIASGTLIEWGSNVTVTPSPLTDFMVNEVKYNDGSDHTVIPVSGAYSFTMPAADVTVTVTFKRETGNLNGYDYVKIAGIKWATTNIGANSPADYGNYYAWGETLTKSNYTSGTYTAGSITTNLSGSNDVASVKWGSTWRMPTAQEFQNLYDATKWTWADGGYYVTEKGVSLNSDKTNALLFFPAAGVYLNTSRSYAGIIGYYWSSTRKDADVAYKMLFKSDAISPQGGSSRYAGSSVRPVSN